MICSIPDACLFCLKNIKKQNLVILQMLMKTNLCVFGANHQKEYQFCFSGYGVLIEQFSIDWTIFVQFSLFLDEPNLHLSFFHLLWLPLLVPARINSFCAESCNLTTKLTIIFYFNQMINTTRTYINIVYKK